MTHLKIVPDAKGSVAREAGKPQRPAERSTRAKSPLLLARVETAAPAPARVDHPILPVPETTTAAIRPKVEAVLRLVARRLRAGRRAGRTFPGRLHSLFAGGSLLRLVRSLQDGPDLFWPRRRIP